MALRMTTRIGWHFPMRALTRWFMPDSAVAVEIRRPGAPCLCIVAEQVSVGGKVAREAHEMASSNPVAVCTARGGRERP